MCITLHSTALQYYYCTLVNIEIAASVGIQYVRLSFFIIEKVIS